MDQQQTFDKVLCHLRTQTMQCVDNGECAYRNDEGRKCAIGALINDEDYHPSMEGGTSREIQARFGLFPNLAPSYLDRLQFAHDNNSHWDDNGFGPEGEAYMSEVAEIYRLRYCSRTARCAEFRELP